MSFTFIIQTNSPGELTSWVTPIVGEARNQCPEATIVIALTPCQYASGQEAQIAKAIPGVQTVYTPQQTLRLIWGWPMKKEKDRKGVVLYLGGDPLYSQFLGIKFRFPVYGYTEHARHLGPLFKKVFHKTKGDLMGARIASFQADRSVLLEKYKLEPGRYCLFFCGSRPAHFLNMAPFMGEVVVAIKKKDPQFQAILGISPFISEEHLASIRVSVEKAGMRLIRGESLELLSLADLLVTLPGTNTAEAMYLQVPMCVLIPLNRPDLIIFDGLLGILGKIPGLGIGLKNIALSILKRKKQFYALPNRMANQAIVPELAEVLTVPKTADLIYALYHQPDQLLRMKQALARFKPSYTIVEEVVSSLLKHR